MAETVHLQLSANGRDIVGESTQHSLQRVNTIECLTFSHAMGTPVSPSDGTSLGRRNIGPVVVRKRIDASTPLLIKALAENQVIKASFKFYRPCPSGDGQTEQFYTIEILEGKLQTIHQSSISMLSSNTGGGAPTEEITFIAKSLTWTFTPKGISHHDSWSRNR